MDSRIRIRIKEDGYADDIFSLTLSFRWPDESEEEAQVELKNPFDAKTDDLLEWYFEKYISMPYDDVKVDDAVNAIEAYGKHLFEQLFKADPNLTFRYRTALQHPGPEKLSFEVIGDSPAFQAIYWESLWDPQQSFPLVVQGAPFLRKNVKSVNVRATVQSSPTLNLLIVTARPGEEHDVDYRTIQRPLIELIEEVETPVKAHILRPGTYEALVKHLDLKAGYYHIIHFDLHGSLLDYTAYKQYEEKNKVSIIKSLFKPLFGDQYSLTKLKKEEFYNGKKAFLFFESREKGAAVPIDAEQLADLLEHKQIPICILNACQSAKQDTSAHETSLGRVLIKKGIQLVLAMRYSVSVSAATLMMKSLYQQLYHNKDTDQYTDQAISISRKELYRLKERKAVFNYTIELEDWLLPVVYQNGKPKLNLRKFTPEEEEEFNLNQQLPDEAHQDLLYSFFGRDLDILKIEKNLLLRSNILLLQGMGGAGKTTLLKYLAGWWLKTGFVQGVYYFGYDIKAYTLNEILYHIAQKICSKAEYTSFTALSPAVQEIRIIKALRANKYALILDNTESITGEKLAILNTLSEEERKILKKFLKQLRGGQSIVIISSRADEEWLKSGTFDNNRYLLQGLDPESASNFAQKILLDIGVSIQDLASDEHFLRLMKLLAGFPLALKAILPNLKNKTAKKVLKELEEGVEDLDKGNVQEKTESIIKCIEYAHSNLSEDAQKLLLCLAPFQSVVNLEKDFFQKYIEELQKEGDFQDYSFDNFNKVIEEAIQNGFMEKALENSAFRLLSLQPVFTYFLKQKLIKENRNIQAALQSAYANYYNKIGSTYDALLTYNEPEKQQLGELVVRHEYENFYKSIFILLDNNTSLINVFRVLHNYLERIKKPEDLLNLEKLIIEKIKKYDVQKMNELVWFELLEIKARLGMIYQDKRQFDKAISTYSYALELPDSNQYIKNIPPISLNKGILYASLGNAYRGNGAYSTAKDFYEKALQIFLNHQKPVELGSIYYNLGLIGVDLQKYDQARYYFKQALEECKKINDVQGQNNVLLGLGDLSSRLHDFSTAQTYRNQVSKSDKYQDENKQSKISFSSGDDLNEQGNYDSAIKYYQKALQIFVKHQDTFRQAEVYNNLGALYFGKGKKSQNNRDFNYSTSYYKKALVVFEQFQDLQKQGQALHGLGTIAKEQQNYSTAFEYFQKTLAIYVQNQDEFGQGSLFQELGDINAEQKEFTTANYYYEKALDIYLKTPNNFLLISNLMTDIWMYQKISKDTTLTKFKKAMINKIKNSLKNETDEIKSTYQKYFDIIDK